MENLEKTFLMVIEPNDFDLRQQKIFYSDFGFVISSGSEFFRDSMIKLCQECHKIRQRRFGPSILTSIRRAMKKFARTTIKTERELLELVAMFFDIGYYTAVSHDKDGHIRKFSIFDGISLRYYGYFGSRDYNSIELIEKVKEKINTSGDRKDKRSCFEIVQISN